MSDGITDMLIAHESLKSYLTQSMEQWGAGYELQYFDSAENEWTVPVLLTESDIEKITTDYSVKKIRVSLVL